MAACASKSEPGCARRRQSSDSTGQAHAPMAQQHDKTVRRPRRRPIAALRRAGPRRRPPCVCKNTNRIIRLTMGAAPAGWSRDSLAPSLRSPRRSGRPGVLFRRRRMASTASARSSTRSRERGGARAARRWRERPYESALRKYLRQRIAGADGPASAPPLYDLAPAARCHPNS